MDGLINYSSCLTLPLAGYAHFFVSKLGTATTLVFYFLNFSGKYTRKPNASPIRTGFGFDWFGGRDGTRTHGPLSAILPQGVFSYFLALRGSLLSATNPYFYDIYEYEQSDWLR